nr:FadR family transcriptional regulator [Solirubrobacterales bacterium]
MEADSAGEVVFKPVQSPTTFEQTVERLGTAIRVGLLSPGSRLPPERELAEQLRISRSTLRQALTTLVQSGHLVALRGRSGGTFVTDDPPMALTSGSEPIDADIRATLDERVAVETGATLLAAERGDDRDLAWLDELVERMTAAEAFDDYRRADVRFHIGLAEAAHSPRLLASMTDVQGRMSDLIALIAHPSEVLTRSNAQHRRIVALLRRRQAARAVR